MPSRQERDQELHETYEGRVRRGILTVDIGFKFYTRIRIMRGEIDTFSITIGLLC